MPGHISLYFLLYVCKKNFIYNTHSNNKIRLETDRTQSTDDNSVAPKGWEYMQALTVSRVIVDWLKKSVKYLFQHRACDAQWFGSGCCI